MRSNDRSERVRDLLSAGVLWVEDGNHGENRPRSDEFDSEGTPFVRPDDLAHGMVNFEQCDRINSKALQRIRKGKGRPGDIAFTHRATVGRIARVGAHAPDFVANPGVTLWRVLDKATLDPNFLYYFMQTPFFMNQVWAEAGNTDTFPYISLTQQRGLELRFPAVSLQRAIGEVLGAIDDRIALLRDTNATLEAIAQALFKSWFVDFDPVRAKRQGLAPAGMDEATAALFPDVFEESALGSVPRTWRAGKVEDLLELAYGKALKATDRIAGEVPVYGSGGITGVHNEALVNSPTVVVGRKGTVGSLYWEDRPCFPIDTVFYVRPKVPLTFCFYQLALLGLEDMNTDGAVPGLNRGNAYRLPVAIPPTKVLVAFDEIASSVRARIFANDQQAQTLATLRDTLLPRLISGQLRLPQPSIEDV
jgi:type I restriction enzyme, S subunit